MMEITTRNANIEQDLMFVYKLRNDTKIRLNCINKDKISLNKHCKWFKDHYQNIHMIYADKIKVGHYIEDEEISIYILPKYWGRGIATTILKRLSGQAIILNHNHASLKAFIKAGFQIKGVYLEKR